MKESTSQDIPFLVKTLPNSIVLKYFDHSRPIAGDRWFVRLVCTAEFPVPADFCVVCSVDEQELAAEVRRRMGDNITYSLTRERNFVDADSKAKIMELLIEQLADNAVYYMQRPDFPQKYCRKEYERIKQQIEVGRRMDLVKKAAEPDEDEGPADFSACFK